MIKHHSMIYVSRDVEDFFLSLESMFELGILSRYFPTPGSAFGLEQDTNIADGEYCHSIL